MTETDVCLKQWAVTGFFVAEGEKLTCLYNCSFEVNDKATVDMSTL